eukprot:scpid33757/ scgid24843/ 
MSGTHLLVCAGHQLCDRDDRLPNEQDRCLSGFFLSLFALLALSVTRPVSVAVEKKASCRPAQNGEGQPSEETKAQGDPGGMEFNPLQCQPHHNQGASREDATHATRSNPTKETALRSAVEIRRQQALIIDLEIIKKTVYNRERVSLRTKIQSRSLRCDLPLPSSNTLGNNRGVFRICVAHTADKVRTVGVRGNIAQRQGHATRPLDAQWQVDPDYIGGVVVTEISILPSDDGSGHLAVSVDGEIISQAQFYTDVSSAAASRWHKQSAPDVSLLEPPGVHLRSRPSCCHGTQDEHRTDQAQSQEQQYEKNNACPSTPKCTD